MKHGKIVTSPGKVDNMENLLVTTTSYYSLCTRHIYGTQWANGMQQNPLVEAQTCIVHLVVWKEVLSFCVYKHIFVVFGHKYIVFLSLILTTCKTGIVAKKRLETLHKANKKRTRKPLNMTIFQICPFFPLIEYKNRIRMK